VSVTVLLVEGVDVHEAYGAAAASLDGAVANPPLVVAAIVSGLGSQTPW